MARKAIPGKPKASVPMPKPIGSAGPVKRKGVKKLAKTVVGRKTAKGKPKTKNYKFDKKTGMKKRKNPTLQRRAKKAAMKRRGKHLKASTKRKIKLTARKTARTGRIAGGKGRRAKR